MKITSVLFGLLFLFSRAFPCTNVLVTKGASIDGSTMITYAADSHELFGELYHWPAAKYPAGTMLDVYDWDTGKFLGKIKQVRETYSVIGNMNEHQLSISETTFGGRDELRDKTGIVDYGSMIYLALQRARTAREAIRIMGELVAEYGYYSSGESISISDPNEVWVLEIIGKGEGNKGALWVALRIPDGYISAHANHARITTFPLNDPNNCLYSPDVISFAREKGYYSGSDKDFSFSDTYAPLAYNSIRFCEGRVWSVFRRVNKEMERYISYIKGESLERMPLWIKPEKKLSVHDVMELMRDHFEGTELDMTKDVGAGAYSCPYRWRPLTWKQDGETYFNERAISTQQTAFAFVSQSRSWLPNPIGGLLWFGMDDTYSTVFVPIYCGIKKIPHSFAVGTGSFTEFTWESAFWVFNFVSNYAYARYSDMIKDIQIVQRELEGKFMADQAAIERTAETLYKTSPEKAREYLTDYSLEQTKNTVDRWKKLGEFLIFKYLDGNVKNEYNKPTHPGYSETWKKHVVADAGSKLKMKKLPAEIDREYQKLVSAGDKYLKEKKYSDARKSYSDASNLKPSESQAKTKIEQIDKLIKEVDALHEKHMGASR